MISMKSSLLPIALLLAAPSVQAKDTEAQERAAKTACLAGDFAKGVAILSELYVSTNDPGYIFNQGRCFEQNHRYEDAVARFQEYLRVGKRISKTDKTDAKKHITDCESLLAKQAGPQPGSGAAAEKDDGKESRERAAMRACLTGDAAAGVAILADLFIDTKDTTYLFNQGRCFEQNRQYEEAIGRFREYLIKAKDLRPEHKADTQKHIAACESYLQGKHVEAAKPEPAKVVAEPAPAAESRPAETVVAAPIPVAQGRAGSGLRITGLVVAVVGGAGLVTGLILNLKANSMSSDVEKLYDPSADSSRKRYETAAWIGYGAGGVCLAGGAVLYYLGWRRGENETAMAFIPAVGPNMVGTVFRGRF